MEARDRRRAPAVPDRPGQNHPPPPAVQVWKLPLRRCYPGADGELEAREEHLPHMSAGARGNLRRVVRWRRDLHRDGMGQASSSRLVDLTFL